MPRAGQPAFPLPPARPRDRRGQYPANRCGHCVPILPGAWYTHPLRVWHRLVIRDAVPRGDDTLACAVASDWRG